MGYQTEAKKCFEFIIQENPKFAPALSNMGYIYALNSNFNKAMELYNQAIALDPDYEQALINKSALLVNMNKKTEALVLMKRIIKNNPNNELIKQAMKEVAQHK
jgi:tetratricopeptide (TPR) repeat protein